MLIAKFKNKKLEGEKWFIACFDNGITNVDHHLIRHDKDPTTFEEVLPIGLPRETPII